MMTTTTTTMMKPITIFLHDRWLGPTARASSSYSDSLFKSSATMPSLSWAPSPKQPPRTKCSRSSTCSSVLSLVFSLRGLRGQNRIILLTDFYSVMHFIQIYLRNTKKGSLLFSHFYDCPFFSFFEYDCIKTYVVISGVLNVSSIFTVL